MLLEVLGTGSAFAEGINSSYILWREKSKDSGILIDCGFSVFPELQKKNYTARIDTALLTHYHQDHCGSAITLAEYNYELHQQPLAVGGVDWKPLLKLCDGREELVIPSGASLLLDTFPVSHVPGMQCVALFLENKILFSGDTAQSLLETPQAAKAKLIIHDAALHPNGAHCSIAELGQAPEAVKAKTWVTHYNRLSLEEMRREACKNGLAGVLEPEMTFEIL